MFKKTMCCLLLITTALMLTFSAYARLIYKKEKIDRPAIIQSSGGTVAEPYVKGHVALPVEKAPILHVALAKRHRVFQLHQTLKREGVDFVRVGEDLTLILPAHLFYYDRSPRLLNSSVAVRRRWLIAQYLNCFEKIDVNVAAYTCDMGTMKRSLALSQQRADNMADSLHHDKVDARLVIAKGFGPAYPIASNKKKYGQLKNERVEISIRMLPREVDVRQTAW